MKFVFPIIKYTHILSISKCIFLENEALDLILLSLTFIFFQLVESSLLRLYLG